MEKIAIINQKGRSGKTTTACYQELRQAEPGDPRLLIGRDGAMVTIELKIIHPHKGDHFNK